LKQPRPSSLTAQGKPLTPILAGERSAVREQNDWLGWELFGNRAVRQGDWKLLQLCVPAGTGDWQLYNLRDDPSETRDLSSAHPEIVKLLQTRWDEYVIANNVVIPEASPVCGEVDLQ
jgi:arylsulfatase A-like enzyme